MAGSKKRPGSALPTTLGGILVGFDQQVFRTTPPPHELVRRGEVVRGLAGEGDIVIDVSPPLEPPPRSEATDQAGESQDADRKG